MERPGVRVHLWVFLMIQVAVWITPVSATEPTSTLGSTVTTTTKLEPTTPPKPVTTVTPSSLVPEPTSTTSEPSTTTTPAPTTTSTSEPSTTTAPEPTLTTSEPSTMTTPEPSTTTTSEPSTTSTTAPESTSTTSEPSTMTTPEPSTTTTPEPSTTTTPEKSTTTTPEPTTTTTETTTKARPRQYGENCTNLFPCETSTVCNNDTHKCQCDSNHYLDTSNGKKVCALRIALGETCEPNNSTNSCTTGLECNNRTSDTDFKCRILAGSSANCTGSDDNCVMSAKCDSNNTCRIALGETCEPNNSTNSCTTGLECNNRTSDTDFKCRILAGSSANCTGSDDNCVMSAKCDSNNTCRLALGETCDPNNSTNTCTTGLQCNNRTSGTDFKCRIPAGSSESCTGSDVNCEINAVCDSGNNCKINLGKTCSTTSDHCKQGTKCVSTGGSTNQCRIPVGSSENCTGSDVNCEMNAVCDTGNKCKFPLGQPCSSDSSQCLSPLSCSQRLSSSYLCRIPAGNSYTCSNSDNCERDAVCNGTHCKINLGKTCSTTSDYCKQGTKCVSTGGSTNQCRIPVGSSESCTINDNCEMNAVCDSGNKCKFPLGQACTAGSNQCLSPLICSQRLSSSYKCRIPAGNTNTCSNNDDNCVKDAQCDGTHCKFPLGQACTAGSNQCLSPLICSQRHGSSYKCRIPAGNSNTCSNSDDNCVKDAGCEGTRCKINLGKTCSTSNDYCKQGTKCVSTSGSTNHCRKGYGSTCSYESECQISNNQLCEADSSGEKKCLCEQGYFKQNNGSCMNENLLNASGINQTGNYEETSISVEWNKPAVLNGAQFDCMAVLSCGETNKTSTFSSNLYYTFNNVAPGSKCQVTIRTQTPRNNNYGPGMAMHAVTKDHFYTKPAKPGNLTKGVYPGPDVTLKFYNSTGHVDTYLAVILSLPESKSKTPSNTATQSVVFTGLEQGEYYNVSIKAGINMQSDVLESETNIQQFRVKPNSSGIVSDLNVSPGNRSAVVTWKIPEKTGGVMTGYKVQVENLSGQCVLEVMFLCTDCTSKPMQNETVTGCATTKNKTTNKSELNNPSTIIRADLEGLLPDSSYIVKVIPYNEEGEGLVDEKSIKTPEEPAEPLKEVKVEPFGTGQLNVSWIPGNRTGPTNYTITWTEETSIESGLWTSTPKQHIIQGYAHTSYVIPGLLSYWNYNVNVQVSAPKGFSPPMSQVRRTASSASEKLKSVNITQKDTAQSVDVSLVCPDERNRNGLITKFKYTSAVITGDTAQSSPAGNISVDSSGCHVMAHKIPVMAETTYEFTFRAVNSENQPGAPTSKNVTVEAKAPELESTEKYVNIPPNPQTTTKSAQIELALNLLNGPEGKVSSVGLRICDKATNCKPAGRGTKDISYYSNLKTWKKCKAAGFRNCEYTIKDPENLFKKLQASPRSRRSVSRRVARATKDYMTYVVGQNQTCESAADTEFCNGPLPENREFIVIVWACTSGGCSEASDSIVIRTSASPESPPPIGAIVGGVLAAVVIIAVVIFVVIMYLRRRRHKDDESDDGGEPPQEIKVIRKPIKLKDFASHLEILHKDANMRFQEEFEVQKGVSPLFHKEFKDVQDNSPKNYSQESATLDANKVKNRYVNILPYDHTRVKLETDDDDETTDFINANYIPGYTSPREYIASQGPMVGTIADFWRMMWEQKSSIIVMLSDLQEKGRPKVDQYWPTDVNAPVQYGDIVVELTTNSTLNKYTIRTFKLYLENVPDYTRTVVQYFIPGWEDYSANLNPEDVIDFISTVRQNARSSQGPICVHCSAGVGRTGTFIALDFLMQFVVEHSLEDEVDIYNLVLNMRHNRPYMVQSERQYVFIHDTLKIIIEKKIKEMQTQEENIYQNTQNPDDNIYANQGFEPEENLYENTAAFAGKPTTSL